jgi:hypothetical protein
METLSRTTRIVGVTSLGLFVSALVVAAATFAYLARTEDTTIPAQPSGHHDDDEDWF